MDRQHFKVGDTVNVMSGVGGTHLKMGAKVVRATQNARGTWTYVTDYFPVDRDGSRVETPASAMSHRVSGTSDYLTHTDWQTARCGC